MSDKKITIRQKKLIAKIWASEILQSCECVSFNESLSDEEQQEVVNYVHNIAKKIIDYPHCGSTDIIVDVVKGL